MNLNYMDKFVAFAGASAMVHGLAHNNLRESMMAGACMIGYEVGRNCIELYESRQSRKMTQDVLRDGNDIEVLERLLKL